MEACFFGAGCTRKDCIFRHDKSALASNPQSEEPCMAYLAGYCAFNAKSCRKRHPPPTEAERLRQKYSQIRCRYGNECQTDGCLYRHQALTEPVALSWTAQPTTHTAPPPMAVPGTSWRPTPPSAPPQPLAMARPVPPSVPPQPPFSLRPMPPSFPPQPPTAPPQPPSSTLRPPPPQSHAEGGFNANAKEFVPGSGFR